MSLREQVIKFCRVNRMRAKGDKHGVTLSYDTRRTSMADWVDYFDTWAEAHAFLLAAVNAHHDQGAPYPWLKSV
jgi:hypothetical protein